MLVPVYHGTVSVTVFPCRTVRNPGVNQVARDVPPLWGDLVRFTRTLKAMALGKIAGIDGGRAGAVRLSSTPLISTADMKIVCALDAGCAFTSLAPSHAHGIRAPSPVAPNRCRGLTEPPPTPPRRRKHPGD